jgi:hypothetical protein
MARLNQSAVTIMYTEPELRLLTCSACRLAAISASARSPFANSFSLLYKSSSRVSVAYSMLEVYKSDGVSGVWLYCMSICTHLDDGVDGTSFLAETAVDTLEARCGYVSWQTWYDCRISLTLVMSMSYRVVFLLPSSRASDSMVMA